MAAACPILFFSALLLLILSATTTTSADNITNILSSFPDYSQYNDLLARTKVADDINSRQTITVLVLNNTVVNSTLQSHPLDVLKTLLSIHVLLDYFDATKLRNIPEGSTISTTLYQTTGVAAYRNGFVNITDSKGKVFFSSATQGSKPISLFTESVKAMPYNISVLEISAPINAPGVLNPEPSKDVNLTAALEGAGCKTFAGLIANNVKVLEEFEAARGTGLTVFAPSDDAWKEKGMPDWTRLSENDLQAVLRYHAAPNYFPMATLRGMKDGFITLATVGADKFAIVPESSKDFVLLKTGVDSARVMHTILDSAPVTLFLIDNVLLPVELFGNSSILPPSGSPIPLPSPTPSAQPPVPVTLPPSQPGSPTPSPPFVKPPAAAPTLAPPAKGPSLSPPAPTGEVPAAAPAFAPAADEDRKKKSGGSRGSPEAFSALFLALVVAFVSRLFGRW